mgnify:CR=1 FL=1
MASNLELDNELVSKAVKIGKHKSKKEAVNTALKEYIQYKEQLKVIDLFGTVEFDSKYNYKKLRNKR